MALYIRPLSIADLEPCLAVETAAFPPAEAATREKIEYRLTVCPEICYGLFSSDEGNKTPSEFVDIPVVPQGEGEARKGDLIAHVISTQSASPVVTDDDMAYPPDWKADPSAEATVGHKKSGRTLALHSLAVSPVAQRRGAGKALMKAYLAEMKKSGTADRVSILTYDRLIPYYTKLGFTHRGKSASEYAGVAWHDLSYGF
ncbi:acyl-CoA N-acyltransferase [Stachybotrys elegans]|uniref:Acyl-CoA N-acyltransferase n=1 Tax=Stachybotrys elegans TaxID=80388 RepID=A0A8K0T4D9_9HYPO|nr:acyl-CoA N-acyltransferase [Stachybotrys elegans]